jgi:hypothetical protein
MHLEWMCDQIEELAEAGRATKSHRWLGFVQAAMVAHRMLDLAGLKAMFDEVKRDHQEIAEEFADPMDHLDPKDAFEIDIGGEA